MNGIFKKAGVIDIDHYAVTTSSLEETLRDFLSLPQAKLIRGPGENLAQDVRYAFVQLIGLGVVEILSPLSESSPIIGHVEAGAGAYHLCYTVEDIDEAIDVLIHNFSATLVLEASPDDAFDGRRVAFLFHRNHGLFELLEAYPDLSSMNNGLATGVDTIKHDIGAEGLVMSVFEKVFKGTIDDIVNCSMETFDKWDSLNHLILIMEIESATGIKVSTDKIADLNSFRAILQFIGDHK